MNRGRPPNRRTRITLLISCIVDRSSLARCYGAPFGMAERVGGPTELTRMFFGSSSFDNTLLKLVTAAYLAR